MENKNALKILGSKFSIYYDGIEVLKNIIPIQVECINNPPYKHLIYSFSAQGYPKEFQGFNNLVVEGVISNTMCKISNGFDECDAYIDSYEIRQDPIDITTIGGFRDWIQGQEIIIYGHVDGELFDSTSRTSPNRFKKKKPEPIESRFDILDL